MESEWGANVARYGLGSLGVTACAPLHDTPLGILTNHIEPGSIYALVAYLPLHPAIDNYGWGGLIVPTAHPHFPYGYNVD